MKIHKVLGIMSGTSLDGLDMAYCHFWQDGGGWNYKIVTAKTIDYDDRLRLQLKNAVLLDSGELTILDQEFGNYLGKQITSFIEDENIEVDLIASHGHTVHHRPDEGVTVQIGSGERMAELTGLAVVCDFRSKDVSLGGQGAPLVPIGDQAFFNNYTFCLNLGGISNVSFHKDGRRIAYDIGIANMLLNYLSGKLNLPYDKGGSLAKSGKLDVDLLKKLDALEYYDLPFPKSTGFEWFREYIIPVIEDCDQSVQDQLHTAVHHICGQIANQLLPLVQSRDDTILVTGGGAYNQYLIEVLREKFGSKIEVIIPADKLISFKEALVFGFMGLLRMLGQINVLSTVTGASKDSSSGTVYHPS